jgi:hypothetical protein
MQLGVVATLVSIGRYPPAHIDVMLEQRFSQRRAPGGDLENLNLLDRAQAEATGQPGSN